MKKNIKTIVKIIVILNMLFLFSCKKNVIAISIGANECKGLHYQVVEKILKNEGFKKVKVEPVYDIKIGVLAQEGNVSEVLINGNEKFNRADEFSKNDEVIIKYHMKKAREDEN